MNTFNRILVTVLLLTAMVACSVLLVVPSALDGFGDQLRALNQALAARGDISRLMLGVLFAVALDIVLILLLILELRGLAPRSIRVERVAGGEVSIRTSSIVERLRYEIDQLPGILHVRPNISARRGGVVVRLEVEAADPLDMPKKAEEIVEIARTTIMERLGLKLARPPKLELRTVTRPSTLRTPASAIRRDREAVIPHEVTRE